MDFDVDVFSKWILKIRPEYVWLGFDSRGCGLPEPAEAMMREFTTILAKNEIPVKGKRLRGMENSKMKIQISMMPMKKAPTLEQIAHACFFLAENDSVTGQIIYVDGCQHL